MAKGKQNQKGGTSSENQNTVTKSREETKIGESQHSKASVADRAPKSANEKEKKAVGKQAPAVNANSEKAKSAGGKTAVVIAETEKANSAGGKVSTKPASSVKTDAEKAVYKAEQHRVMASLKVGLPDQRGDEIVKVHASGSEFVIYDIKTPYLSESLRTYVHTMVEEDKIMSERYTAIRELIADAKGIMYKAVDPMVYKATLAQCIANGLHGGKNVEHQFQSLLDTTNKEYREQFQHRANYLMTAGSIVICCIILSIFAYTTGWFDTVKQVNLFIYVGSAGSIGGFVSVSRRLKDTVFDRGVPGAIFIMYATERIVVAIFAALIVLFAVKCDLVFGMLTNKIKNPLYGYIVFGILAGFSETFLPNLLIKLENKS